MAAHCAASACARGPPACMYNSARTMGPRVPHCGGRGSLSVKTHDARQRTVAAPRCFWRTAGLARYRNGVPPACCLAGCAAATAPRPPADVRSGFLRADLDRFVTSERIRIEVTSSCLRQWRARGSIVIARHNWRRPDGASIYSACPLSLC